MTELCITIRFLDPRFHGRGDGGEPEWPPSPMRLFQALLAAAKARWSDDFAAAFEWLETQPPPTILAPTAQVGSARLTYVPNNNTDSPSQLRTGKTIQPTLIAPEGVGEGAALSYRWPVGSDGHAHAQQIARVARGIRALGWGIDLAVGRGKVVVDSASRADKACVSWHPTLPWHLGLTTLRCPSPGSLESLENAYAHSLSRVSPTGTIRDNPGQAVFTQVAYGRSNARPAIAFALQHKDNSEVSRPVSPGRIKALVAMIRSVASSASVIDRLGQDTVNRVVLGHPKDRPGPRLSILPLPSIGHPHCDGRIRNVILAEPFGSDGRVLQALGTILHGVDLKPTYDADDPGIRLIKVERPGQSGLIRQYHGNARVWTSATPVLLPGYDKHKKHRGDQQKRLERAEQLVCKALQHAGIDRPVQIELSRVPLIPGTAHAQDYRPREKMSHYPRYHVRLIFARPLPGPLSIGAGRHVGFGVMARSK